MRPELHRERSRTCLSAGTLARFADGMTWEQILEMTAGKRAAWWRMAVADAETRGLLVWDRSTRWILTPVGRAVTRGVS